MYVYTCTKNFLYTYLYIYIHTNIESFCLASMSNFGGFIEFEQTQPPFCIVTCLQVPRQGHPHTLAIVPRRSPNPSISISRHCIPATVSPRCRDTSEPNLRRALRLGRLPQPRSGRPQPRQKIPALFISNSTS